MSRLLGAVVLALLGATSAGAAPTLIGAEACGNCHVAEYEQWKKTRHAEAYLRLSEVQRRDRACLGCHTSSPASADPELLGVQCESCHGAGSLYAPNHVMRDGALARLYGLEAVSAETCAPCHASASPSIKKFDYTEALKLITHGKKPGEKANGGS